MQTNDINEKIKALKAKYGEKKPQSFQEQVNNIKDKYVVAQVHNRQPLTKDDPSDGTSTATSTAASSIKDAFGNGGGSGSGIGGAISGAMNSIKGAFGGSSLADSVTQGLTKNEDKMEKKLSKASESFKKMKDKLNKAKVDEGLSPQRKATARAKRNDRSLHVSPNTKYNPTMKQHDKFNEKKGAMPGKHGDKVYGVPKKETGVHHGDPGYSHNLPGSNGKSQQSAGVSLAGVKTRYEHHAKEKGRPYFNHGSTAKELHEKKLSELKTQKTPDLGKSERPDNQHHSLAGSQEDAKGVGRPNFGKGRSASGYALHLASKADNPERKQELTELARDHHRNRITELKSMPKPDLGKSENMTNTAHQSLKKMKSCMEGMKKASPYEKGVHQPSGKMYQNSSETGDVVHVANKVGQDFKNSKNPKAGKAQENYMDAAKGHHERRLTELQSMKAPNLGKSEDEKAWEVPGEVP